MRDVGWQCRMMRSILAVLALASVSAGSAEAATIHIFHAPGVVSPSTITAGRNGSLWFVNGEEGTSIGRITTSGRVTIFRDRRIRRAADITGGPDGAIWFTNGNGLVRSSIGRLTADGRVRLFFDRRIRAPGEITPGPDGALWFCNTYSPSSIGRITPTGTVTTFSHRGVDTPLAIVPAPDQALWFITPRLGREGGDGAIWRITTAGTIQLMFDDGISGKVIAPLSLTVGPDGALWYVDDGWIGRITTSGRGRIFDGKVGAAGGSIVSGSDGALWFVDNGYDARRTAIVRMTTDGHARRYAVKSVADLTPGPDRAIWFTSGNSIGRLVP